MEIKPFSFVAPASRMPESALTLQRELVLHLFTTWPSLQAAATPDFVHTCLAGRSGRVFRNTNPIYFVDLKLSSRKPRFATHDWAASRFPSLVSVIL